MFFFCDREKKNILFLRIFYFILIFIINLKAFASQEKLIIAHRGASGYLPEHTLASAALAFGMKADFLELDVISTKDGHLIVMHDLTLNATTNVEEIFPERSDINGNYYSMEFKLEEVKRLGVNERSKKRKSTQLFPERFPNKHTFFKVPTLEEIIKLVRGLNKSHGRMMGLYIEIKGFAIHKKFNLNPVEKLFEILDRYDYREVTDPIWIQSFDSEVLKLMRKKYKTKLRLTQLIGENRWNLSKTDFDYLKTSNGLKEIATYANGIGPWMQQVVSGRSITGDLKLTAIVKKAHELNMIVHPYTIRADKLPSYADSFNHLLHIFFNQVKVDGIFTDFPDHVFEFIEKNKKRKNIFKL